MPDIDDAAKRLGIGSLRPRQRAAIETLSAGRDVLAIIPTGGGKSAIYQVATELGSGVTLVVSPLLALQEDQLRSIAESGLGAAVSIDGSTSDDDRASIVESLRRRETRYLFTTPEILRDEALLSELADVGVDLFAVDEAHCIVSWGEGFRPDFLVLGDVRRRLGSPTTVALTGSADPRIRTDICGSLDLVDAEIVTADLERSNISLRVQGAESNGAAADLLVADLAERDGKALVYVPTRELAERVAGHVGETGRRALPFHGGLKKDDKSAALDLLHTTPRAVVVATTAFGMGIDIPDIASVLHLDMPESLIAYYQEVGRGGRDGAPATGSVYVSLRKRSRRAFASGVKETTLGDCAGVYVAIQKGATSRRQLISSLPIAAGKVARAVQILTQAGAIVTTPELAIVGPSDPDHIERLCLDRREFDRSQMLAVERYRSTRQCRWAQIMSSLGEPLERCGHCDVCDDAREDTADEQVSDEPFPVGALVEHGEFGPGCVVSRRDDVITVSFDSVGPKDLASELCVEESLIVALHGVDPTV